MYGCLCVCVGQWYWAMESPVGVRRSGAVHGESERESVPCRRSATWWMWVAGNGPEDEAGEGIGGPPAVVSWDRILKPRSGTLAIDCRELGRGRWRRCLAIISKRPGGEHHVTRCLKIARRGVGVRPAAEPHPAPSISKRTLESVVASSGSLSSGDDS